MAGYSLMTMIMVLADENGQGLTSSLACFMLSAFS